MTRLAGLCSLVLILASLGITGSVVLGHAAAVRAHVRELHFPVMALGEGIHEMVLPILLCTLGTMGALLAVRHKIGRVALGAAVLNWAVILVMIGIDGFKSLL